jgi:hypothetical protein
VSRVAILSGQSLFAEGLLARLRQQLDAQSLIVVDARKDDALNQVIAAQPAAVVVDVHDSASEQRCQLGRLLEALPMVTIVRLNAEYDQVQVVTSSQRTMSQVQDLIDVIKAA